MIVEIKTKHGESFYTESGGGIETTVSTIKSELPIRCFWYGVNGQKFEETFIFLDDDLVVFVRTDSDAEDRRRI